MRFPQDRAAAGYKASTARKSPRYQARPVMQQTPRPSQKTDEACQENIFAADASSVTSRPARTALAGGPICPAPAAEKAPAKGSGCCSCLPSPSRSKPRCRLHRCTCRNNRRAASRQRQTPANRHPAWPAGSNPPTGHDVRATRVLQQPRLHREGLHPTFHGAPGTLHRDFFRDTSR